MLKFEVDTPCGKQCQCQCHLNSYQDQYQLKLERKVQVQVQGVGVKWKGANGLVLVADPLRIQAYAVSHSGLEGKL